MKLKGLSPVAYRTQSFRIICIMLIVEELLKLGDELLNYASR